MPDLSDFKRMIYEPHMDSMRRLLAEKQARISALEEALRLARKGIITVNTTGWDSVRGEEALAAISAIDRALGDAGKGTP